MCVTVSHVHCAAGEGDPKQGWPNKASSAAEHLRHVFHRMGLDVSCRRCEHLFDPVYYLTVSSLQQMIMSKHVKCWNEQSDSTALLHGCRTRTLLRCRVRTRWAVRSPAAPALARRCGPRQLETLLLLYCAPPAGPSPGCAWMLEDAPAGGTNGQAPVEVVHGPE